MLFRILIVLGLCLPFSLVNADVIKLGVLSNAGFTKAIAQWQPTADYLSERIPAHSFQVLPYRDLDQLHATAASGKLDFALTHPASHVQLADSLHAERLLTRHIRTPDGASKLNASAIFTRAENNAVNTLEDLKHHSLIALAEQSFFGWISAWSELKQHQLDPYTDLLALTFADGDTQAVIDGVLSGQFSAGVLPAGELENLAASGRIELAKFKIISARKNSDFPYVHSTALYPEWPLLRFQHTPDELVQQVCIALLAMPLEHKAAEAGDYRRWSAAVDYQAVRHMLKPLHSDAEVIHADNRVIMKQAKSGFISDTLVFIIMPVLTLFRLPKSYASVTRNAAI